MQGFGDTPGFLLSVELIPKDSLSNPDDLESGW